MFPQVFDRFNLTAHVARNPPFALPPSAHQQVVKINHDQAAFMANSPLRTSSAVITYNDGLVDPISTAIRSSGLNVSNAIFHSTVLRTNIPYPLLTRAT